MPMILILTELSGSRLPSAVSAGYVASCDKVHYFFFVLAKKKQQQKKLI